jgi:hypothetical protein
MVSGPARPAAAPGACGRRLPGGFGAVLAGVEEAFSASVGAPAGDQAAAVPLADRLRGHVEVSGDLTGGEHAGGAEPAGVGARAACVAERGQVLHGEGPSPPAGDPAAVEDLADLVEGVVVEELADQLGGGGGGGVLFGGGERPRQGAGVVLAAGEADLAADGPVAGSGKGDVGDSNFVHVIVAHWLAVRVAFWRAKTAITAIAAAKRPMSRAIQLAPPWACDRIPWTFTAESYGHCLHRNAAGRPHRPASADPPSETAPGPPPPRTGPPAPHRSTPPAG